MELRVKRVYQSPSKDDGQRILVDRLWPRGLSKEKAGVAFWARDISPSTELRRWYGHDPEKWQEFRARYFQELDSNPEGVRELLEHVRGKTVTFVCSSTEPKINNAVALKEYVESRL